MKKILVSLITVASLASAGGCLLVQSDEMNVTWEGYKTLDKVAVSGQFTAVDYVPNKKEGKNFKELLVGSKVSIALNKINTHNEERDKTLLTNFFEKFTVKTIEGEILSMKADPKEKGKRVYHGVIDVNVSMNGTAVVVPMKYNYEKENFTAKGTINLFAFKAEEAFNTLHESCSKLHKGVTWAEVGIGFSTTIKATLCAATIEKKK